MYVIVSVLRITCPEPGKASVESTKISDALAVISLTKPVRYIADEFNACLALVLRLRLTNFVNITFGELVYPTPSSVTIIDVILPCATVAIALAPIPPPPVIKM